MPLTAQTARQGVKGKQVQILYDLVTVNRRIVPQYAIAKVRRRGTVMTRKPGNLPVIGTGRNARVTRNWPRRSLPLSGALPSQNKTFLPWEGLFFRRPMGFLALNRILFKEFLCERHKEEEL